MSLYLEIMKLLKASHGALSAFVSEHTRLANPKITIIVRIPLVMSEGYEYVIYHSDDDLHDFLRDKLHLQKVG